MMSLLAELDRSNAVIPLSASSAELAGHPAVAGQVVLVMQGGGAQAAYQGGVYQALHEANLEPDWVIGTSIGAINGSIIAGQSGAHPPTLVHVKFLQLSNRMQITTNVCELSFALPKV